MATCVVVVVVGAAILLATAATAIPTPPLETCGDYRTREQCVRVRCECLWCAPHPAGTSSADRCVSATVQELRACPNATVTRGATAEECADMDHDASIVGVALMGVCVGGVCMLLCVWSVWWWCAGGRRRHAQYVTLS